MKKLRTTTVPKKVTSTLVHCLLPASLAFTLLAPCRADAPDKKALLAADPRLALKVTFERREARVGELLDAVTRQTGVRLYAS